MTDRVFLEGLKVETLIGVYDWEREIRQNLWLDVSLAYDCAPAARDDDISKALDYDALSRHIRSWAAEQNFELIETFGERLCQEIHRFAGITDIELRINKAGAVADCQAVGIRIRRTFP